MPFLSRPFEADFSSVRKKREGYETRIWELCLSRFFRGAPGKAPGSSQSGMR